MSTGEYAPGRAIRDGDLPAMKEAIIALSKAGHRFERKTQHQLKIGSFNFYPGKGTIFVDDEPRARPQRGLEALLTLLGSRGKTRLKVSAFRPEPSAPLSSGDIALVFSDQVDS